MSYGDLFDARIGIIGYQGAKQLDDGLVDAGNQPVGDGGSGQGGQYSLGQGLDIDRLGSGRAVVGSLQYDLALFGHDQGMQALDAFGRFARAGQDAVAQALGGMHRSGSNRESRKEQARQGQGSRARDKWIRCNALTLGLDMLCPPWSHPVTVPCADVALQLPGSYCHLVPEEAF